MQEKWRCGPAVCSTLTPHRREQRRWACGCPLVLLLLRLLHYGTRGNNTKVLQCPRIQRLPAMVGSTSMSMLDQHHAIQITVGKTSTCSIGTLTAAAFLSPVYLLLVIRSPLVYRSNGGGHNGLLSSPGNLHPPWIQEPTTGVSTSWSSHPSPSTSWARWEAQDKMQLSVGICVACFYSTYSTTAHFCIGFFCFLLHLCSDEESCGLV
jgi:hypothetical protein